MAYNRLFPIFADVPQGDPEMGIPELPNWGINPRGMSGGGVGSNLRNFKPRAGGDMGGFNIGANSAEGMLRDIYKSATQGTTQSFDTAANRLRERVDAAGQSQKASAANGMRGLGGSGLAQNRMRNIDQDSMFSYGQGLAGLESQFEGFRQQGLQTSLGAAGGLQEWDRFTNQLGQNDLSQRRSLNNESSIANMRTGFDRASALDNMTAEEGRSNRANALQMLIERMRDSRERDISRDRNDTELKLGKRMDLSRILQLLEGL